MQNEPQVPRIKLSGRIPRKLRKSTMIYQACTTVKGKCGGNPALSTLLCGSFPRVPFHRGELGQVTPAILAVHRACNRVK